jgi:hypothetical protein
MTTRKLVEYVFTQAKKFGWETQTEGTGICDDNGCETHMWLSHPEWKEMEFYYYVKPKRNGYDYTITDIGLTRSELGDGCKIIRYEYTTKEQIDDYFRASGASLKNNIW